MQLGEKDALLELEILEDEVVGVLTRFSRGERVQASDPDVQLVLKERVHSWFTEHAADYPLTVLWIGFISAARGAIRELLK